VRRSIDRIAAIRLDPRAAEPGGQTRETGGTPSEESSRHPSPPLRPCLPAKTELNRRRDRLDFLRHRFFWYARFSIVRLHLADENETSGASLIDPRIDLYFTLEFNSRARAREYYSIRRRRVQICVQTRLYLDIRNIRACRNARSSVRLYSVVACARGIIIPSTSRRMLLREFEVRHSGRLLPPLANSRAPAGRKLILQVQITIEDSAW